MGGWYHDAPHRPQDAKQSANLARLFDRIIAELTQAVAGHGRCYDTALLCEFHALAMHDVIATAGRLREREVEIRGSRHQPPPAAAVAALLDQLFVDLESIPSAIEGAAFVMWRLNWIHPFDDGNGRIARSFAMLVLFARLRRMPQSYVDRPHFFDLLARYRLDYFDALEAADRGWAAGVVNVRDMAALLFRVVQESLDLSQPGEVA